MDMKPALSIPELIDDRPEDGVFRVNRALFSDADIFEQEMQHIFEGGWIFLGMSAQAPEPHDFFTTRLGRAPVIVMRDKNGVLRSFLNACPHKGARIASQACGQSKLFVCPYHSWTFDSSGRNKAVKWQSSGCYDRGFQEESHDLAEIAQFGEYRGFLFGSLKQTGITIEDFLGDARVLLDLVADQSEEGLELVPGRARFTYRANWKMQLENCSDQYHFTSTHPSYIRVLERRSQQKSEQVVESSLSGSSFWKGAASEEVIAGSFSFHNGHVVTWGKMDPAPSLPLFEKSAALREKFGDTYAGWMFNMRNLTLFPNMQLAVNAAMQLRVIRPIAHNLTEMETWCLAPKGESAEARRLRLRQYEDFFNPTGMAIPDDNAVYEECQPGMGATGAPWLQGHARGLAATRKGGNEQAAQLGVDPVTSVAGTSQLGDETLFQAYYHEWARRMEQVPA